MAKKKQTHPFHIPVPTKIGFAILAIAVMVYGISLVSIYTQNTQTQTIESHAAYPTPNKCQYSYKGTCYNVYQHRCAKRYIQHQCPGPSYVQCCPK